MCWNCSTGMPNISDNVTVLKDVAREELMTKLTLTMDVLLISLMVLLMLSFGCSLEVSHIRQHLSKPISVSLSMVLHFIVMPYTIYAILNAIDFNHYDTVSLVVLGTAPSGGIGNLFVGYAEGDLALGIIIVAVSHVLGVGFMPLNLWLFSRTWDSTVVAPYIQTITSLVTILLPVAVGMIILRRKENAAKWISRVCSIIATFLLVATTGLSSYMYPEMYTSGWSTWFISVMFTPIGFLIGYLVPLSMRMPDHIRRTLGITTGTKSLALCLTIIAISFPKDEYLKFLVCPELHSIIMIVELALYCFLYRFYRWIHGKYFMKPKQDDAHKQENGQIHLNGNIKLEEEEKSDGMSVSNVDMNVFIEISSSSLNGHVQS